MENLIYKYLFEKTSDSKQKKTDLGPVVTISREFGCSGSEIAQMLTESINKNSVKKGQNSWRSINKEILGNAAKELDSKPSKVERIMKGEELGYWGDIIGSFLDKQYVSDENIKNTITRVIRGFAEDGRVIIVGRAGYIVARHVPKSFHVKLIAPFDWRVDNVDERFNLKHADAVKTVKDIDEKRNKFLHYFKQNSTEEENFDLIINRKGISKQAVVDIIISALKSKNLI